MLKYVALACAVAFMAGSAQSAELERVSISFASQHIGAPDRFNETNPGLFFTFGEGGNPFEVTVGMYDNSYENTSVLLTTSYDVVEWEEGALSLFAGTAYYHSQGEKKFPCCEGFVPIGGLQVRQGNLFAQIIPNNTNVHAVMTFGLTFELE